MNSLSKLIRHVRPIVDKYPQIRKALGNADRRVGRWQHSAAAVLPAIIEPRPRQLTIAITAKCNLACVGCRYGRDFMVAHSLSWSTVKGLLEDARDAGVSRVRLYGGEPLLHPDLSKMVEHSVGIGVQPYVTTNGVLLRTQIKALHLVGLRLITSASTALTRRMTNTFSALVSMAN